MKRLPKWLRDTPAAERATRLAYLHHSLKELRQVEHGWDAKGGFRLDKLKNLSAAKVRKLTEKAGELHVLKTRNYVLYRPRKASTRATIAKHIGRRVTKKTKAVIVHTTLPRSRVRVKAGKVQTITKVISKDGSESIRVERNYYFMFPREPRDWDDFMAQVFETVKNLPKGAYSIMSSRYDLVGTPMLRQDIMNNMQRWFDRYEGDKDKQAMPETLIGLRWVGRDYKQSDGFLLRYVDQTEKHNEWRKKLARKEKDLIRRRLSKRRK